MSTKRSRNRALPFLLLMLLSVTIFTFLSLRINQSPVNPYGRAQINNTPTLTPTPPIAVIDAENGLITAPFVSSGATTPGYVYQPNPNPTVDPDQGGEAIYSFTVPPVVTSPSQFASNEEFIVKMLVNVQEPNAAGGLYVNIDGEPDISMIWDIQATNGFQTRTVAWRGSNAAGVNKFNPKAFSLAPGQHTVVIRGQSADVKVSQIIIEEYGCLIDTNVDGVVNIVDYNSIVNQFGDCQMGATDANGDGCTTIQDVAIYKRVVGTICRKNLIQAAFPTDTPPIGPVTSPIPTETPPPRETPTSTPFPTPTTNTTLIMNVREQGITTSGSYPPNFCQNFLLTVTGASLDTPIVKTVCFQPSASKPDWIGSVELSLLVPIGSPPQLPTFSIYLKGPKHLQKRICDAVPTETAGGYYHCNYDNIPLTQGVNTLDFTGILLLAGDLPITNGHQNGVIDSEDTSYIRQNFGQTDSTILTNADLNLDGVIDTQDYSLVIAALSIKYDDLVDTQ